MSRGLGKVQKGVLECLEAHGDSDYSSLIEWIWGGIYFDAPTEMASVSRAITTLEKRGLVKRYKCTDNGNHSPLSEFISFTKVKLIKC